MNTRRILITVMCALVAGLFTMPFVVMHQKSEVAKRIVTSVQNALQNSVQKNTYEQNKMPPVFYPPAPRNPSPLPQSSFRENKKYIKILFLGDVMLGRYVRTLMERNGLNYPFEKIREGNTYFSGFFDKVVANLEGPIVPVPNRAQTGTNFGFAPDTADILKQNGITTVTIANNHTLDQGQKGLESTKKYLDTSGIEHFGHPILPGEEDVLYEKIQGKNFAFIGFHDATHKLEEEKAIALVKEVRARVDVVVIIVHWGIEYQHAPSKRQLELSHALVDAGADLIIGHHPHVVQTREEYKGVQIIYSLGNFIFDQYWSKDTQKGLAIEAVWTQDSPHPKIYEHPLSLPNSQPIWKWGR